MYLNPLLTELKALLSDAPFCFSVCGGFALELFMQKETRPHGDVDLCALESQRTSIQQFMLSKGWELYEFRGQGKVRPLNASTPGQPGRNLMCVKPGCDLVEFYPCEEEGLLYHQFFHKGITSLHYLEFLFSDSKDNCLIFSSSPLIRRELSSAFLHRDGISYLAPEIALLYKALQPELPQSAADYASAFPLLSPEQKRWFVQSLAQLYPGGHPWQQVSGR